MPRKVDDARSGRLRAALEAAGDAAYAWDLASDRIEWSGRLSGTGLDPRHDLATGRALAGTIFPDDLPVRRSRLAEPADAADFACDFRLPDGAGGYIWVEERGRIERDGQGRPRRAFGVLRARRGHPVGLGATAGYDPLTGHFGRFRLREAVDSILSVNRRAKIASAFLAIAVDDCGADRLGRAGADSVLVEVGRRLDLCLRVSDVIGRFGEDRFGILLACCPRERIDAAAQRIVQAVTAAPVETAAGGIAVTVSMGIAACPPRGGAAEDLIAGAERALAEAQRGGRGGCVRFRPTREERAARRRGLAAGRGVREALREDRLLFAFQPVVSAQTGEVDYFECLLRIRCADGQIATGGDLVKTSEKLGLVGLIDRFGLDRAAQELAAHPDVRLGLNVSGLTAGDRRWLRSLISLLRERPQWARRLVVEITETATLDDIEESARFVNSLRHAGCRVAIDDFGAGHTSLQHLHRLAVDTLKIDGSLVRNLSENPDNQSHIRDLLGLARSFGFTTLAECVETAEDAEILRQAGIGYLQGYHVGRPTLERAWLSGAG